jgi:Leucine-rich repeat (LRR) protein
MKLKGKEKVFWWHFGNITASGKIPTEIPYFVSKDSVDDDDYLFMLTSKVKIIHEIYLKDTDVTDQGVKYLTNLQGLKTLTLSKHETITKNCLPYINKLVDLEYLDVSRTKISLCDLVVLSDLTNLKELHIRSENYEIEYILEYVIKMKEILPNCILYIDDKNYES